MKRFQMVYLFLVLIVTLQNHEAKSGPPPPPPLCEPEYTGLKFICCGIPEVYHLRKSIYTKCCGKEIYESNSTKQCCGETIFDPTYAKVKCCNGSLIPYIQRCKSRYTKYQIH